MTKRSSRSRRTREHTKGWHLTRTQRDWIALLTFLGFLSRNHGSLMGLWLDALRRAFGWGVYLVPVGLAILGVWIITLSTQHPLSLPWPRVMGALILFAAGLAASSHLLEMAEPSYGRGGGYVGYWLSQVLSGALGWAGATVILVVLATIGFVMLFQLSVSQLAADWGDLLRRLGHWLSTRPWPWRSDRAFGARTEPSPLISRPIIGPTVARPSPREPVQNMPESPGVGAAGPYIAHGTVGDPVRWMLPRIEELLNESSEKQMSLGDIREKTRIIEETLGSLGVPVTVVEVNPGPVVTQFGLEPGYIERRDRDGEIKRAKVKVSRISALANDLALALAAPSIRIEAPVPGKGIVGLEIPNSDPSLVSLRGVMESEQFRALTSKLALALGRDVSGMAVVDDLSELPHLLIAGATGSGKSVCINAFIACLLFRNTPDDLKLLMVDPKRVELSAYNGIPHLIAPVVVEPERVVGVLNWVTREMDRRYKVFARAGARNIQSYNEMALAKGEAKLPFIVVFIDELADLMMVSPEEVERLICRIAQMARATGIHLVVATQRPSVDVVTGLIKANFPARLSFAVSSQIDSRVILDTPGAEKLLGRGDALYMAPDSPKLLRIQGCYVHDNELARLIAFWQAQPGRRAAVETHADRLSEIEVAPLVQQPLWPDMSLPKTPDSEEDPLLAEAIALVKAEQKAAVSFLQKRLRIGYTRAARLIDILEEKGIVGPSSGPNRMREVLDPPMPRKSSSMGANSSGNPV